MKRRDLLQGSMVWGLFAAAPSLAEQKPLQPEQGSVPVAFLISESAVIIDFCGPWEVFQDADVPGRKEPAFRLYTVAETRKPIRASGGMQIVADYDLPTAPAAKEVVIPAQNRRSEAERRRVGKCAAEADV